MNSIPTARDGVAVSISCSLGPLDGLVEYYLYYLFQYLNLLLLNCLLDAPSTTPHPPGPIISHRCHIPTEVEGREVKVCLPYNCPPELEDSLSGDSFCPCGDTS